MNEVKNENYFNNNYIACATCKHWSGNVEYNMFTKNFRVDLNKDQYGRCNSTFLGAPVIFYTSCSNWEKRFDD